MPDLGAAITGNSFIDGIITYWFRQDSFYVNVLKSVAYESEFVDTLLYGRITLLEPEITTTVSMFEALCLVDCMHKYVHELPEYVQQYFVRDLLYGVNIVCSYSIQRNLLRSSDGCFIYQIPKISHMIQYIWIDIPDKVQDQTIYVAWSTSLRGSIYSFSAREFGTAYQGQDHAAINLPGGWSTMRDDVEMCIYIHATKEAERFLDVIEVGVEHIFLGPALADRMAIDKFGSLPTPHDYRSTVLLNAARVA